MMVRRRVRQWWRRVIYFFPLQLLVLHVKKNHLLLFFWAVLWAYITSDLGVKYGIPYVFLYPEYFGHVNFLSYLLTGFALGGFITAFNLYSYTMHAYRFPFIATLSRPFLKFNINNAIIPVAFVLSYLYYSARLQLLKELVPPGQVAIDLAGFVLGIVLFQLISLLYFTRTNTDITKVLGHEPAQYRPEGPFGDLFGPASPIPARRSAQRRATRWLRREQRARKWHVETYLVPPLRIALARSSRHYDKELLRSVLWQNHINGSIFEVIVIVSFIALGAFSGWSPFEIPTGASAFLLFTMLLMIISALYSWLKGWTLSVIVALVLGVQFLSLRTDAFLYDNQAYGLDYQAKPAPYTIAELNELAFDSAATDRDRAGMEQVLDRWLAHAQAVTKADRPPLVIVSTSGGGLRSMLWTCLCMQELDSVAGGDLLPRTAMITGSSGGLIGAAYYRQSYIAHQDNDDLPGPDDPSHLDRMSRDILNPVAFTFVTNDMFIRYQRVVDGHHIYTRDRGYVFEERLNENTDHVLDVRLRDLEEPERDARVPMLLMAPTSVNDGRRLLISALPAAHLTNNASKVGTAHAPQPESIEFQRMFKDQDAEDLKLTSALRMSATFPYITPMVTLPSDPPMRVMDAGIRDNYGYRTMSAFLLEHRTWIAKHTSGVIVLQLRDTQKLLDVQPVARSLMARLFDPASNVYGNFVKVQDQDYDLMLQQVSAWIEVPLEVIDLQLHHDPDEEISLSWHLTAVEKHQVLSAIRSPDNQAALERFHELIRRPDVLLSEVPVSDAPGDR
ncbi:MAG: patatin-like phospholipase family protein [Flavobacteriales bacterium]|nr:patatin-like phospholipase family protein [Flavobacteriales bacterium]